MSSDAVWKQDAISIDHPSREAILAFIREQCAEDEKNRIDEHLRTGCEPCSSIHTGLKQDSDLLNQLFDMPQGLYYPELQSYQTWLHMRRGVPLTGAWTGRRKRRFQVQNRQAGRHPGYRTGLRVFRFSIPFAFGMLLLFTTVAIVLAYSIANIVESQSRPPNQLATQGHQPPVQTTIEGHRTPTATDTGTNIPGPAASPTPAPTIIKGAKLTFCGWPQYTGWICGHGFKGVNRVWLIIESRGSSSVKQSGPYPVDSAGNFEAFVGLYCNKGSSIVISATNKAQQPLTLPLTYGSRSNCYSPSQNATTGSYP